MNNEPSGYGAFTKSIDVEEMDHSKTQNQLVYSNSTVYELMVNNILKHRVEVKRDSIFNLHTTLLIDFNTFMDHILKEFSEFQFVCDRFRGVLIEPVTENILSFNNEGEQIVIKVYGDREFTKKAMASFDEYPRMKNYVKWVYSDRGDSIDIPLTTEKSPIAEMYPFLNGETLESYYDRYMASSANILLLIGPPGTGKTTFIRGLLQHTKQSAVVTYNDAMLNNDSIFADFIGGSDSFMVMEDADTYLEDRTEGNTMMHRFLNVADGLVTTKGKKMIFSTNLASTSDIDPALIRPGRCHDVLHFKNLNEEQASALAAKLSLSFSSTNDEFSIAEIFHKKESKIEKRKIGFQL